MNLLEQLGIEAPLGAAETEITAFELQSGLPLPERLHALYALCDGAIFRSGELEILPLAGVLDYVEAMRRQGFPQCWGYFPFTENNDSNPFCVCCDSPLTGYVVQVFHGDSARVKFRSIDSFLAALQEFVSEEEWDLHDLPSEFQGIDRTVQDITAGRELLRLAPELEGVEQEDAFRFGMWLLSEPQVGEIVPLLEHQNEDVRHEATRRLSAFQSLEAQQALRKAKDSMKQFVKQSAEALALAGIEATIVDETSLRLEAGPVWLNMDSFYSRRSEAGVYDFLVERSRVFLSRTHSQ